jgi:hypothetical protein
MSEKCRQQKRNAEVAHTADFHEEGTLDAQISDDIFAKWKKFREE